MDAVDLLTEARVGRSSRRRMRVLEVSGVSWRIGVVTTIEVVMKVLRPLGIEVTRVDPRMTRMLALKTMGPVALMISRIVGS